MRFARIKWVTILLVSCTLLVALAIITGILLPNGGTIAFSSYTDADIYLLDVVTGYTYNLTHDLNASDFHPVWSPDGSQLSFVSIGGEQNAVRVFVMDADGSGLRLLADYDGQTTGVSLPSPR
jgi:Tol biopolymer transport system component